MFLVIVGYNVRIRVIAYCFQHAKEAIDWHFKEVRRLCWLGKIFIRPNNRHNVVPSYIASNPK